MRVLITGADGALGHDLVSAFDGHGIVACDHGTLDVQDRDRVLQVLTSARPHVVVNAAAWTDVDGCESDPEKAFAVNALGVRHVAEGARLVGAWLCQVSTDYVFDGLAGRPYVEWDRPNPISVYGRSKLGGELEVGLGGAATIVRTAWLAGRRGRNFVRTVLERAGTGAELDVVDDQIGSPTFTLDLAGMIHRLMVERRQGVFHVTNQGAASWYELAREALAFAGLDPERVRPISAADLDPPRPAPRPRHAVLDNAALRLSGVPLLAHYREPLERLVKELTA